MGGQFERFPSKQARPPMMSKEDATRTRDTQDRKSSFFCFFLPHLLLEGRRSPPRQPHQPPTKQNVPYKSKTTLQTKKKPNVTHFGQYYILPFSTIRPKQRRPSLLNCLKGNTSASQTFISETTISLWQLQHGAFVRLSAKWLD